MRANRADGGRLIDLDPESLDGRGETGEQLGRVHARDVGGEAGPDGAGDTQSRLQLVGRQLVQVSLVETVYAGGGDLMAQALQLCVVEGDREPAALDVVGVDSVLGDGRRDSSTVSNIARCSVVKASSCVWPFRAYARAGPEKNPEIQPPLRPDAPEPAFSRSSTTISSDGCARFR